MGKCKRARATERGSLGSRGLGTMRHDVRMKIIVEYTVLNGRRMQRDKANRGAKFLSERDITPENAADFPRQHIEYFVEEGSDVGRTISSLLGLSLPS